MANIPLVSRRKITELGRFIYLFGVLRHFQHCTGHITTGSWKGRGNQYIYFVRVLYCKLPTNSKQLPAVPLEAMPGTEPWPQRWEARVLPLCHHGPSELGRMLQKATEMIGYCAVTAGYVDLWAAIEGRGGGGTVYKFY